MNLRFCTLHNWSFLHIAAAIGKNFGGPKLYARNFIFWSQSWYWPGLEGKICIKVLEPCSIAWLLCFSIDYASNINTHEFYKWTCLHTSIETRPVCGSGKPFILVGPNLIRYATNNEKAIGLKIRVRLNRIIQAGLSGSRPNYPIITHCALYLMLVLSSLLTCNHLDNLLVVFSIAFPLARTVISYWVRLSSMLMRHDSMDDFEFWLAA